MKTPQHLKLLICSAVTFLFLTYSSAQSKVITAREVIFEVNKSINESKAIIEESNLPNLTNVEIILETTHKKLNDGSIKIFVFTFGKKREKKATKKMTFAFEPKAEYEQLGFKESLSKALRDAIVQAAEALKDIDEAGNVLKPKSIKIELGFYITDSKTEGLSWDVLPISGNITSKFDSSRTGFHSVKLVFGKE